MKPYTFYFEIYGKLLRCTVDAYNSEDAYAIALRRIQKQVIANINQVQPKQAQPKKNAPSDQDILNKMKDIFGMG
jgi:hypothetical protein